MAIFYLDYVNGNDANAGTSWALAWKTLTLGATAARIAPGDTIRIAKSPDPTSLGQTGTWTDGPLKPTQAIASSTNATPIVVTLSGANYTLLAPAVGDTLIVNGHTTNTKANGVWTIGAVNGSTDVTLLRADGTNSVGNGVGGASGTVRKFNNAVVKLASAVTANIAVCGNQGEKGNWTASANVTNTVITSDFKEGGECQQIAVAAGFTTGLAAYFPTGTIDLSAYQQVSFWIKQTAGTLGAASSCSLKLCSDTAGATAVDTINIPALGALNAWSPITVDLAGALGSSIQSIALYVNTDNGAQTFLLDNIIACKASSAADSLSLTSLIGKNSGTEPWLGLQSINGTRIVLDASTNTKPTNSPQRGYSGTTETVTAYKRETIKTTMAAASNTAVQTLTDSGTVGSLITFEGGYNTGTSTVDGVTFFDGQNGLGYGVTYSSKNYISLLNISTTRYFNGFYLFDTNGSVVTLVDANNSDVGVRMQWFATSTLTVTNSSLCATYGVHISGGAIQKNTFTLSNITSNGYSGLLYGGGYLNQIVCTDVNNNGYFGVDVSSGTHSTFSFATVKGNEYSGLRLLGEQNYITLTDSPNNVQGSLSLGAGLNFLRNSTLNSSTKISSMPAADAGSILWSTNENNNTDTHFGYTDGGLISSDITTRHTASGISWKLAPTSTNRAANYPLPLKVGAIACAASVAVTFSMWFRRTNTGLTARLICKGGQLSGVAETSSSMTAAADTWEQLSVTVTPTQKGVLEFYAECWGGTTYSLYVDDVTVA